MFIPFVGWSVLWFVLGAVLVVLAYQVPVTQDIAIGHYDSGFVQGFGEAANRWGVVTDDTTGMTTPYRWTSASAAIIFPQVGLPAKATIRLRGWRPAGEPLPRVRVLLNGTDDLGTVATDGTWQEVSVPIRSGIFKPQDVFLQLDTDTPLVQDTLRLGVQIDRAVLQTTGWPIMPYPAQILGGSVATLLAGVLVRRKHIVALLACGLALGFLLLYRMSVLPFAMRWYWFAVCGVMAVALTARAATHPNGVAALGVRSMTWVADALAVAVIALWAVVLTWIARQHVVLSIPGVEKDFRVFATRSDAWWCPPGAFDGAANCVWRADGFYQLGYPALLWALRPFTQDNPFLAAQIIALVSGGILLGVTYLLARSMLGTIPALLALLAVALNRWTTSYSLYLGTDMPFTAACAVALLLVLRARKPWHLVLAGVACGVAFAVRHPGIVLLVVGWGWLWLDRDAAHDTTPSLRSWLIRCGLLAAGFIVASLPQLVVNVLDTGNPLYSQQAKNIWLAVYGNTDWDRWGEASNDVSLLDIVLHNPLRFVLNWMGNLRMFLGGGSENTDDYVRVYGPRLLAFPANLLAIAGVVFWVVRGNRKERWLLGVMLVYVAAIAVGFMHPRFVLPLVVIAALAAADAARRAWHHPAIVHHVLRRQLAVALGCAMLAIMAGSVGAGRLEVLNYQNSKAVRAVAMLRQTLRPDDRIAAGLPASDTLLKYSAVAHRVAPTPQTATVAVYTDGAIPADLPRGQIIGRAGPYVLERINP